MGPIQGCRALRMTRDGNHILLKHPHWAPEWVFFVTVASEPLNRQVSSQRSRPLEFPRCNLPSRSQAKSSSHPSVKGGSNWSRNDSTLTLGQPDFRPGLSLGDPEASLPLFEPPFPTSQVAVLMKFNNTQRVRGGRSSPPSVLQNAASYPPALVLLPQPCTEH